MCIYIYIYIYTHRLEYMSIVYTYTPPPHPTTTGHRGGEGKEERVDNLKGRKDHDHFLGGLRRCTIYIYMYK